MFAMSLLFPDGAKELLFLRRHRAIIGVGEDADVTLEGVEPGFRNIEIARLSGREFSLRSCPKSGGVSGTFAGQICKDRANISWGEVSAEIFVFDCDLLAITSANVQLAEAQVLKNALTKPAPVFPLIAVESPEQFLCSFPPEFNLLIGRARSCAVRIQHPGLSAQHARIVYQNDAFWVEPVDDSVVTVKGQRITEVVKVPSLDLITLGSDVGVKCVKAAEELADIKQEGSSITNKELITMRANQYPCVVSDSSFVRPGRAVVGPKQHFTVGRDPASDIWIGAAHISHNHLEIFFEEGEAIVLVDHSSNGTFHKGRRLPVGQKIRIDSGSIVLDFQAGIELVVCFSYEAEQTLLGFNVSAPESTPSSVPSEESRVFLSDSVEDERRPIPKAATPGETHDFDPHHQEEMMSLEEAYAVGRTQKLLLIGAIVLLVSLAVGFTLMLQQ